MTSENATLENEAIDIIEFLRLLISKKWLIMGFAAAGLGFGIILLNVITATYTTELKVTPASSSTGKLGSKFGGVGNLAALAGVTLGPSSTSATPFELYLDRLKSLELANELANDPVIMTTIFARDWDQSRKSWKKPSLMHSIIMNLKTFLGRPKRVSRAPNGARLQTYLEEEISIKRSREGAPIVTITFEHENPKFAVYLLSKMDKLADNRIREKDLARATKYSAYWSSRLETAVVTELRKALSEALIEQERSIMMSSSDVPYSVIAIEPPSSSDRPTKPSIIIVLMVSFIFGGMLGSILALTNLGEVRRRLATPKDTETTNITG